MKRALEELKTEVIEVVQEIAIFIRNAYGKIKEKEIFEKGHNLLVSRIDREAEALLLERLAKLVSNPSFLAEESEVSQVKTATRWIVDPLDGTTNFLHQIPCFAISIALEYKDEIVLGVVHEINRDETFSAWKGGGAYLNDQPIQVRKVKSLSQTLIATGFPYHDYERIEAYCNMLKELMKRTRGIRRLGSAATDLAYTAAGRFDAFFEYSLSPWDVAAGSLIAKEAGALVCDFSGGRNYLFGEEIVAASPGIAKAFMQLIRKNFG